MSKPLTAEQIATACACRDRGDSLRECALAVHRDAQIVRDALIEAGYAARPYIRSGETPERRKEAYRLYMVEGLALRKVCIKMHIQERTARRWILAEGGQMRTRNDRTKHKPKGNGKRHRPYVPWSEGKACPIGSFVEATRTTGYGRLSVGSNYCAEMCDWTNCQSPAPCRHLGKASRTCTRSVTPDDPEGPCRFAVDMCDRPMTVLNLWGFAKYKAARTEHERKRNGDSTRGALGFDMLKMWGGSE